MWATNEKLKNKPDAEFLSHFRGFAELLNFDFAAGKEDQLGAIRQQLEILTSIELVTPLKKPKEVMACQSELRGDLIPILAPETELTPDEAEKTLKALLKKINEVEDRERAARKWDSEMADHEWQEVWSGEAPEADYELLKKPPEDRGVARNWWLERRLTLMGYDWFLGSTTDAKGSSLRDLFYLTLSDALEKNAFDRLRVCRLQTCHKFFVADDARQKFCSPNHRNEFNNKQRLVGTYYQERRQKARKTLIAKARRLLREGKSAKAIRSTTKLSLRVLRKEKVIP